MIPLIQPAATELSAALSAGQVWWGDGGARQQAPLATGHPSLDAVLGGGWPPGQLLEILVSHPGQAELSLLLPALRAVAPPLAVLLIAPPYVPYAPGLVQQGLSLSRLLVVKSPTAAEAPASAATSVSTTASTTASTTKDLLWTLEEALTSGTCGAVMAWIDAVGQRALSRLQLAAARSACLAVLIRSRRTRAEASPVPLRIDLRADLRGDLRSDLNTAPADAGLFLRIEILKNRFGPAAGIYRLHVPATGGS